jgi:hypothetical protein
MIDITRFQTDEGAPIEVKRLSPLPVVDNSLPFTAFNELATATPDPIIQILGMRGINGKTFELEILGGTVTSSNGELICSTGVNAAGLAALTSSRTIAYRPGQGLKSMFTARFTQGVADSLQLAGLNNAGNGFNFGYSGETFGINRRFDGAQEIQDLQVTVAASGAEDATVTVDGVGYTVSLTAITIPGNAREIADSLNTQVPNWDFEQNDDTVVARSTLAVSISGAFSFSSSTAAATWTQIASGIEADIDFTPQDEWNIDKMPKLNPIKGNVYKITIQYLGYGAIVFSAENPETGRLTKVHRIQYANANTKPVVTDPTFTLGISAINEGNTSDVIVRTSSLAAFNEGLIKVTEPPRAFDITVTGITDTEVPIFSIRNRLVAPASIGNLAEIINFDITGYTDSDKGMIFRLYLNGTLTGYNFNYVEKIGSISSIDTSATAVAGPSSFPSIATPSTPSRIIPKGLILENGDLLTVTAQSLIAAPAFAVLAIVWQEDL